MLQVLNASQQVEKEETSSLASCYINIVTYPNTELESCDSEAISGAESRLEVAVEAALQVDDVHLKGEGRPVVGVLGPLGVVLAPVEVELEDLVSL